MSVYKYHSQMRLERVQPPSFCRCQGLSVPLLSAGAGTHWERKKAVQSQRLVLVETDSTVAPSRVVILWNGNSAASQFSTLCSAVITLVSSEWSWIFQLPALWLWTSVCVVILCLFIYFNKDKSLIQLNNVFKLNGMNERLNSYLFQRIILRF